MTTVNRLKNKKKTIQTSGQSVDNEPPTVSSPLKQVHQRRTKGYNVDNHSAQKQKQYESYYEISQCNPIGVTATSTLFPHSQQMGAHYNVPMGFVMSPTLFVQNQNAQVMQKSADRIPRCGCCRAYMNCYNKIDKKRFTCFLCNRQNQLDKDYNPNDAPNDELNSSIYQAIGASNFYSTEPTQQTFVFFIDINSDAANTRMLYYAVAAMKEVLARPELDDICVYFYTYDEFIQEYDFSGEDIKCTIVDQTIQGQLGLKLQSCLLKDIRDKIFNILDALQEISQNNNRKGSNFIKCFNYVFHALKHTEAKFFVLQCNQAINGQQIFWQELPKNKQGTQPTPSVSRSQSLFETQNKTFFTTYVEEFLKYDCSLAFFSFTRNYRNYRTIHDTMKLTNSQIKLYNKDSQVDLDKFYYDFSYLLGATYFKKVRVQFVISQGWYFTAIYGNFYRVKQYIIFQIPNVESSRKMLALVCPSKNVVNTDPNPYCCIQLITNYRYKRQNFICVSTIVQPLTGHLQRLYASIDPTVVISAMARGFMSSLRMQPVNNARKKLTDAASLIYTSALQTYKKAQNIPDTIMTILMAVLAMLKSAHSQPQLINNTPTLDKIVGERNYLQFCGPLQLATYFSPYLFDLSNMDESMCRQDIQFAYPPTIQAKFHNTRDGLFLLDNGLSLYLFVAKTCDHNLLKDVFGHAKLSRNDVLNQQLLNQQTSFRAIQVQTLVKFLRQQKSYGWIPLYVVRCGQNTLNERNFYLQFYPQKYEQFRNYKLNLEQFLAMLSRPNSF